jgi:PAS domain S-box-containing protein
MGAATEAGFMASSKDKASQPVRHQAGARPEGGAAAEALFGATFNAVATPIVVSRREDGVIVAANRAWELANGRPREQAIGRSGAQAGHWTDLEARARILARVDAEGRAEGELVRFVTSAGRARDVLVSCVRVILDGVPHLVWSSADVTQLRMAEQREHQMARKYAALFDTSPEAIAISRIRDGTMLEVNEAWQRTTGVPREAVIGRLGAHVALWHRLEDRGAVLEKLAAEGRVGNFATRFVGGDGKPFDVLLSVARIDIEGEDCALWSWRDVSDLKAAERRAHQSLEKFAALFETHPEGIVVIRADRSGERIAEINDSALEILGIAREEAVGAEIGPLLRWLDVEAVQRFRARMIANERVRDHSMRFARRDGREIEILVSSVVVELDGWRHAVASFRDVTEQRRQQRALAETEERLEKAFLLSQDAIGVSRLSDSILVAVNPQFERLYGAPAAEMVGRTAVELGMWESLDLQHRERVLEQLRRDGRVRGIEGPMRTRSGGERQVIYNADVIEIGGEPHAIGFLRDVTEERGQQRALAEIEERFAKAFEASHEAITITRRSDRLVVAVNPRCSELYGAPAEDIVGKSIPDLGIWEDSPQLHLRSRETLDRDGRIRDWEVPFRTLSGEIRRVQYNAALIEIGGEPHTIAFFRDVTAERRAETRARESERKFAALFENSPEAITLMRVSDGVRLAANAAWERITGHSREIAVGQPAPATGLFPDPVERARLIERAVNEGRVSNVETKLARADGTLIDALISGARIDLDGEDCILWCWRDVTDERAAERARRLSDERYRTLFESSVDGMAVRDGDGMIQEVNAAFCALLGYGPGEVVGRQWSEVLRLKNLEQWPLRSDVGTRWARRDRVALRKDGSELPIEILSGPLPGGAVLAIVRDNTERKRNESLVVSIARAVSAEVGGAFFRSLVEHLARDLGADFAYVAELVGPARDRIRTLAFTADGRIVPNIEYGLAGTPCEEVVMRRGTVFHVEGTARSFGGNGAIGRLGVEGYAGTCLVGSDGAVLGVLVVMSRRKIERPGFWTSMLEIFGARAAAEVERARTDAMVRELNATLEQRVGDRTRELEELNRDLDSYNYSVSHDLRQPLNAITGFSELLRERLARSRARETLDYVGEIEANARRMEQMIEALLSFARAGRDALVLAPVDTQRMVESVLRDLTGGVPQRARVSVGPLPAAYGDETLLRQVWTNLISNALKYSARRRQPRIEIRGERRDGELVYTLSDNGIGFDMRYAGQLFGVFQRLPNADAYAGTGVGLAIVQRILRRHGGSIEARSAKGKGTTMRFSLPVARSA